MADIMDSERVFQAIAGKRWQELVELIRANPQAASDPVIQHGLSIFIREFVADASSGTGDPSIVPPMRILFLLHRTGKLTLEKEDFEAIVVELVRRHEGDVNASHSYAQYFPEHEVCIAAIARYEAAMPKMVQHSQASQFRVTESKNVAADDCTISLFKSPQEFSFFMAVRNEYHHHFAFPNVSASSVIDFDRIKNRLPEATRRYFFTTTIDCVVIDPHQSYKPIAFFELDSSFHDSDVRKSKDVMKDDILAAAGQKLYRVRSIKQGADQSHFTKLIRELLKAED